MTQLITHPGTNPTLCLPVARGVAPDDDAIWRHLAEPAEFFDMAMPARGDLRDAVRDHAAAALDRSASGVSALTVTLFEVDGAPTIVVHDEPVSPTRKDAVRIAAIDAAMSGGGPGEPLWRRMAARTTSRGDADQLERWLAGRGYADAVPTSVVAGAPYLGALVFDTPAGLRVLERPAAVSLLDQLVDCGVAAPVARLDARPTDATAAWWVSRRFETHPVASIDGRTYAVVPVPPFLEMS